MTASTVLSILLSLAIDALSPDDSLEFTAGATLAELVITTNENDLTNTVADLLSTEVEHLSLPLGDEDMPGCRPDEVGSATLDIAAADPKQILQVSKINLRAPTSCRAFRLTTKPDTSGKIGLLVSPKRPCDLRASVELTGEQRVKLTVVYSRGTEPPSGCAREQTRTLAELRPRPLEPFEALVVYDARTADPGGTQVKLAVDALEGTATQTGVLFNQAVQQVASHCAYNRGNRIRISGRVAVSDLQVGAGGLALQFHAEAYDVGIDDHRDCLRELNGGVAPIRGEKNRTIQAAKALVRLLSGGKK